MTATTISFEHHPNVPGFYWLIIRVGQRAVGSIARNMELDKNYYLEVHDSYGNTCHAKHYATVEKAKEAFLRLPLSILPVGGEFNASGARIDP